MLAEYSYDFVNMGDSIEDKRINLSIALIAWNLSLFTDEKREEKFDELIESVKEKQPHLGECDLDNVRENIRILISEKERLFPNVKKFIVDADIQYLEGDKFYVTAVSSDFS